MTGTAPEAFDAGSLAVIHPIKPHWLTRSELLGWRLLVLAAVLSLAIHSFILVLFAGIEMSEPAQPAINTRVLIMDSFNQGPAREAAVNHLFLPEPVLEGLMGPSKGPTALPLPPESSRAAKLGETIEIEGDLSAIGEHYAVLRTENDPQVWLIRSPPDKALWPSLQRGRFRVVGTLFRDHDIFAQKVTTPYSPRDR